VSTDATRYPLSWPRDWKRTTNRQRAKFGKDTHRYADGVKLYDGKSRLSIEDSFRRIEYEMERFGVSLDTVIVSTNLRTNMRGLPTGASGEPSDPGVAVYWTLKGKSNCMAIDRYDRVADNLAAVAATLDSLRSIERHGGGLILERAFLGFAALPSSRSKPWREVLGFTGPLQPSNRDAIEARFRELAKGLHPDKPGGDSEAMIELNTARDAAVRELSEGW
jgi:hypothetical protein